MYVISKIAHAQIHENARVTWCGRGMDFLIVMKKSNQRPCSNRDMTSGWGKAWIPMLARNLGLKWQQKARKRTQFVHFVCSISRAFGEDCLGSMEFSLIFEKM
jgi:hypothetical protein